MTDNNEDLTTLFGSTSGNADYSDSTVPEGNYLSLPDPIDNLDVTARKMGAVIESGKSIAVATGLQGQRSVSATLKCSQSSP